MAQRTRSRLFTFIWTATIVAGLVTATATWWRLGTSGLRLHDGLLCLAITILALASTRWPVTFSEQVTYFVTSGFTVGGALLLPAGYTSAVFAVLLLDRLLRSNRLRSLKRSLQAAFSMSNILIFTQLAVLPVHLEGTSHIVWPLHFTLLLTAVLVATVPANMIVFLMAALDTGQPWKTVAGNNRQTYISDMIVTYLGVFLAQLWQQQPWELALAIVGVVPAYWLLRKVQAVHMLALQEQTRATAAEELARIRGDFVASVSHELRTPLTAIVGYAELLEARWDTMSEAVRLDHVRRISLAAARQRKLVEEVLLTSHLERQPFSVECRPTELDAQIAIAVSDVRGSYPGQQIETAGTPHLIVLADATRLVQILTNVLDNAAKYSPEQSAVEMHWEVEGAQVVVHVRDHGRGIPVAERHHLFTRFGRIPGSIVRAGRSGTGLGLYISSQLATGMGGSLDLEDSGPQGSTFRLRLPLSPPPESP